VNNCLKNVIFPVRRFLGVTVESEALSFVRESRLTVKFDAWAGLPRFGKRTPNLKSPAPNPQPQLQPQPYQTSTSIRRPTTTPSQSLGQRWWWCLMQTCRQRRTSYSRCVREVPVHRCWSFRVTGFRLECEMNTCRQSPANINEGGCMLMVASATHPTPNPNPKPQLPTPNP